MKRDMDKLIRLILLSGLVPVPCCLAALKGTATQSSTWGGQSVWAAQTAIDGFVQYCSATSSESNPWWRLDLLDVHDISTVIITARSDCCLNQINGAEIHIGNSLDNNGNNNPICAVTSDFLVGKTISFSCHVMEGRYVNLVMTGRTTTLSMCEVEVYGVLHYRQKNFLRLKFSSSGDVAAKSDKILQQIQQKLTDLGVHNDTTVTWRLQPDGNVFTPKHEDEEKQKVCSDF